MAMMSRPVDLSNAAADPVHFSRQKFADRPEQASRKDLKSSAPNPGDLTDLLRMEISPLLGRSRNPGGAILHEIPAASRVCGRSDLAERGFFQVARLAGPQGYSPLAERVCFGRERQQWNVADMSVQSGAAAGRGGPPRSPVPTQLRPR